jgi:type I restriction enzyme S subunit
LGEVCEFKNGFAFKSSLFRDHGLPIIRITNIDGFNVNLDDVKFFDPSEYKEDITSYAVQWGDILIAMSGATTGKIGYYTKNEIAYLNQRVGKFAPNPIFLNSRFLYHWLILKNEMIYVLAGGGAQPNLSSNALKDKLQIPIPPLAVQARIVAILDKFDTLTHSISEGLPREIELRQKQYEYYRNLLLNFPKPKEVVHV